MCGPRMLEAGQDRAGPVTRRRCQLQGCINDAVRPPPSSPHALLEAYIEATALGTTEPIIAVLRDANATKNASREGRLHWPR